MSWSTVATVLQVLIYIILFLILIYLLILFFYKPTNDDAVDIDSEDTIDVRIETAQQSHRGSNRERYNIVQEQVFLDKALPEHKRLRTVDFKTYKQMVESHPQFIQDYYQAILVSYRLKTQRYVGYAKKLSQEIKNYEANAKSSFSFMGHNHDTSYERNKYCLTELQAVIKAIKCRVKQLSPQWVRDNLLLALNDQKRGFASLVGRQAVKDKIAQTLFSFCRSPQNFVNNFNNYCVVGDAGVGKTKLCESMAFIFKHSGLLARGTVTKITKTDITSSYVAESESITRKQLYRSFEGILHMEEIYDLAGNKMAEKVGISHGKNALNEIIYHLDEYVGLSIVLISGYKDKMENQLFAANQGLRRRFPNYIHLTEYNATQLTKILIEFIYKNNPRLVISIEEEDYIYTLLASIYQANPEIFRAQAGAMLNLSADITSCINSSIDYVWTPGQLEANKELIRYGFNQYLTNYGLSIFTASHSEQQA